MRVLSVAVLLGLSVVTLSRAFAAIECDSLENINARMKSEGQRSLIYGDEVIDGKLTAVIYTADASGSVGYELRANAPMGTKPKEFCVTLRMQNVRLYDTAKPTPGEALLRTPEERALAHCRSLEERKEIPQERCGFLNAMMEHAANERITLQGQVMSRQADGSYRPIQTLLTLTTNQKGRGAILMTFLVEGSTVLNGTFTGMTYTEAALRQLAR